MAKILTVNLPDIGEGVVEGEVIEWLKKEGDTLAQDEPVVVVMTDKATVELPTPYAGVLKKHHYAKGDIAKVHHPLYDVEAESEELQLPSPAAKEPPPAVQAAPPRVATEKVLAPPAVRQLAKQLGVDLSKVTPTGKEGQVTVADVKAHLNLKPQYEMQHFPDDLVEPMSGIKALMAEAMARSKEIIPHFTYFEQLDATNLKRKKESWPKKTTLMPFYLHALSTALKEIPLANSSYDEMAKKIYIHRRHNIGIAVDTPYGLIVPVLKHVEKMSLEELVDAYEALKLKAKTGQLASSDMKEATITVTNFGTLGGYSGTPIIPHPNVAILGLGKIETVPAFVEGSIVPREKQMICWSFDHRLIDGAIAAKLSSKFTAVLT